MRSCNFLQQLIAENQVPVIGFQVLGLWNPTFQDSGIILVVE